MIAIDLREGVPLPSNQLYNLPKVEREAMEADISESLASGLICLSSSPVGTGFFFAKKDRTLCPCIDYPGLNKVIIQKKYPLPLLDTTFASL